MYCKKCDQKMVVKRGLEAKSKVLSSVHVPFAESIMCSICGYTYLTAETSSKVDAYVKELEGTAIGQLPIEDFITLNEAANLLNLKKQAIQQNKRIKRGFVYAVKKGRSPLYHKRSLEMFHQTGDGRFNLMNYQKAISSHGAVSMKLFVRPSSQYTEQPTNKHWKELVTKAKLPQLNSIVE